MKKPLITTILSLFIVGCHFSAAQNSEYPWSLGIGFNTVDFYPNGEGVYPLQTDEKPFSEELFSEFFNRADHYNSSLMTLRASVGRYLFKNISLEVGFAYNQISNYGDMEVDDLDYVGVDGSLQYSFRNLLNPRGDGLIDPFIGMGGGFTWVEEERTRDLLGTGNIDGTVGLGFWINNRISLILKTTFKYIGYEHEHKDYTDSHFQHFIGIKYVFVNMRQTCYNF